MPLLGDLAKVSKQQGIAAAVALGLLLALLYLVKAGASQSSANAAAIDSLGDEVEALGDLVVSACQATPDQVEKFVEAKRVRGEARAAKR